MKPLGAGRVVVMGKIDLDLEHAGARLTEVFVDSIPGFDNHSPDEAIVKAVEVVEYLVGFCHR